MSYHIDDTAELVRIRPLTPEHDTAISAMAQRLGLVRQVLERLDATDTDDEQTLRRLDRCLTELTGSIGLLHGEVTERIAALETAADAATADVLAQLERRDGEG